MSFDDYRKRRPLIVTWDDHETANNPWMHGVKNHQVNEGVWEARREASLQAYYEWLPIRQPSKSIGRRGRRTTIGCFSYRFTYASLICLRVI